MLYKRTSRGYGEPLRLVTLRKCRTMKETAGRSILDAVEKALELPSDALGASREVLSRFGNMSSATVMFVLERLMEQAEPGQRGCAMAFGPGLTAETMRFHVV